uniref:Uncharacterized protein n=1 Tax=viral metagenome TaxID=1070528 RepID=A0A6M3L5P3_9ZZZZ
MFCSNCGIEIKDMINLEVLKAAVRWMEYGDSLKDEKEYKEMLEDETISKGFKRDITCIRQALKGS